MSLSDYTLAYCANGCADGLFEYQVTWPAGTTIAAGGTYSVCNSGLGDTSGCDQVIGTPYYGVGFNGDDFYTLARLDSWNTLA